MTKFYMSKLKTVDDLPDDCEVILDENFPRYILEPFKRVFPGEPEYETALTREQINKIIKDN